MVHRQKEALQTLSQGTLNKAKESSGGDKYSYMPSESYYGLEARMESREKNVIDVCPDRLAFFLNYIESKGPSLEQVVAHIKTLSDKAKVILGNLNM